MNDIQRIMNAYFDRAMMEASAKYGTEVYGKGTRIVATSAELREVWMDVCESGVPVAFERRAPSKRAKQRAA